MTRPIRPLHVRSTPSSATNRGKRPGLTTNRGDCVQRRALTTITVSENAPSGKAVSSSIRNNCFKHNQRSTLPRLSFVTTIEGIHHNTRSDAIVIIARKVYRLVPNIYTRFRHCHIHRSNRARLSIPARVRSPSPSFRVRRCPSASLNLRPETRSKKTRLGRSRACSPFRFGTWSWSRGERLGRHAGGQLGPRGDRRRSCRHGRNGSSRDCGI